MSMNSGYYGWSMSQNAVSAYEQGEMPKSKWTKAAMVKTIKDYCENEERVLLVDITTMKKEELFNSFYCYSSWHHTSKFCNSTDFYSLDEEAVIEATRPMTVEEKANLEEIKTASMLRKTLRDFYQDELRNIEFLVSSSFRHKHGFAIDSWNGYKLLHPDKFSLVRKSLKGNKIYKVKLPSKQEVEVNEKEFDRYASLTLEELLTED